MSLTFSGTFSRKISERLSSVNRNFPEQYSVTFGNSGTMFQKFPLAHEIDPEFWLSRTFSIMEMEKISGSFPYVNSNPEFRWKP